MPEKAGDVEVLNSFGSLGVRDRPSKVYYFYLNIQAANCCSLKTMNKEETLSGYYSIIAAVLFVVTSLHYQVKTIRLPVFCE